MKLRKWNYELQAYEPYEVSDEWDCRYYGNDMEEVINCCQCGKETTLGYSYSSQVVHTSMGFGYMVCEECHEMEMKREFEENEREWKC